MTHLFCAKRHGISLNLFITSKISDRLSMLTEAVVEADSATNQFGSSNACC